MCTQSRTEGQTETDMMGRLEGYRVGHTQRHGQGDMTAGADGMEQRCQDVRRTRTVGDTGFRWSPSTRICRR